MECREAIDILNELTIGQPSNDELVRAIDDFAIPAMEKEIARDVELETGVANRQYYACPNCTDFIKWRHNLYTSDYMPDRCPGCGQTLNWEGK